MAANTSIATVVYVYVNMYVCVCVLCVCICEWNPDIHTMNDFICTKVSNYACICVCVCCVYVYVSGILIYKL